MEIGLLTPQETPWLMDRSVATGWAQLVPQQQAQTTPAVVAAQVQGMLQHSLSQPGSAVLVARENGMPVGYLVVTVVPDELTRMPTGLFIDIWVEPAWRGKGISSQLTAAGESHLKRLGVKAVRRMIAAHNAPSLRHARADGCQLERYMLIKPLS